ncbi:MAG: NADPH:quinone reductase [Betaproteobacteria bacterium]|nr:MAG: NADPH:quinone reductase [Betaproteobacteria bacterium]
MRAAWYTKNGSAREVLTVGELPTPVAGPGEVRVRLHASGVNPSDVKSRRGRPLAGPLVVPHSDGAGVIDDVGVGVSPARVGERVWIWNGQWKRSMGTAAEFIALPGHQAVALPDSTDSAAGACLGIPALTAYQAVRLLGDVEGKRVLVIGASSVVGHYATQIAARRARAIVFGTVGSEKKAAHARAAGASETIEYKRQDVVARIRALTEGAGVDAIIDMDFSTTVKMLCANVLAPHGTLVCYGSNVVGELPLPFTNLLTNSLSLRFFLVYELSESERCRAIDGVTDLLEAGHLAHTIGARFPLDQIASAHEAVEAGAFGNVVIELA